VGCPLLYPYRSA